MTVSILVGDCRDVMRTMAPKSVHMCVTSIPYWGLRDYKIKPSVWGGDPACAHEWGALERGKRKDMLPLDQTTSVSRSGTTERQNGASHNGGCFCFRCDAWLGCYGLEPDYRLYVEHTVEIFAEVWRVLRDDGTLWLNIGDCYATSPNGRSAEDTKAAGGDDRTFRNKPFKTFDSKGRGTPAKANGNGDYHGYYGPDVQPNRTPQPGLKQKDLAGIPWRVAFALQDAGWYLRRDIIWHKANPMPESVYDRPTTSHEYLFLFAKSGATLCWRHRDGTWVWSKPAPDYIWRHRETRQETREPQDSKKWFRVNLWRGFDYYYEFGAIMESSSPDSHARAARSRSDHHKYADGGPGGQTIARLPPVAGRYPTPAGWDFGDGHHGAVHRDGRRQEVGIGHNGRPSKAVPNDWVSTGKAKRFNATRLPSRDGASSRTKIDRTPGATRKLAPHDTDGPRIKANDSFDVALCNADLVAMRNKRSVWPIATEPFREAHFATFPTALIEPCILAGCPPWGTVLDPFGGAGTTGMVADRLQRNAVLIELNPDYAAMAERRIRDDLPLFHVDVLVEQPPLIAAE